MHHVQVWQYNASHLQVSLWRTTKCLTSTALTKIPNTPLWEASTAALEHGTTVDPGGGAGAAAGVGAAALAAVATAAAAEPIGGAPAGASPTAADAPDVHKHGYMSRRQ